MLIQDARFARSRLWAEDQVSTFSQSIPMSSDLNRVAVQTPARVGVASP
jgi:hypothetical protein